jgi:hypothetical protein
MIYSSIHVEEKDTIKIKNEKDQRNEKYIVISFSEFGHLFLYDNKFQELKKLINEVEI